MNRVVVIPAARYAEHLKRLAETDIPKALARGLKAGAARAIPVLQRATETAPPANPAGVGTGGAFNTGQFKWAWRATAVKDGVEIANLAPYAAVIENGRRPGAKMPPAEAINRWAQRKLGLSKAEAKRVGFLMRRAIARRGLKGRKVLENASDEVLSVILLEVIRALEEAY